MTSARFYCAFLPAREFPRGQSRHPKRRRHLAEVAQGVHGADSKNTDESNCYLQSCWQHARTGITFVTHDLPQ